MQSKLYFVALLLWGSSTFAEGGVSYLGMCHKTWPCDASLRHLRKLNIAVILGPTFNDTGQCPCLARVLSDPRPKTINIKIANGPCLRNKRCGPYEIFAGETIESARQKIRRKDPSLLNKFKVAFARASGFLRDNTKGGPLKCYLSTVLEHDFGYDELKILDDLARPYFPQCEIVYNPVGPVADVKGKISEAHGSTPRLKAPCISDLDGEDFQKVDLHRYQRVTEHCLLSFVWGLKLNCNDPHSPNFVDPRKRVCTANDTYFSEVARYTQKIELPPLSPVDPRDKAGCATILNPKDGPGGFTWKQSDVHPGAVLLLPRKYARVYAMKDGKVSSELRFAALFKGDNRPIYRSAVPAKAFKTRTVLHADSSCYVLDYPQYRID